MNAIPFPRYARIFADRSHPEETRGESRRPSITTSPRLNRLETSANGQVSPTLAGLLARMATLIQISRTSLIGELRSYNYSSYKATIATRF